MRYWFQSIPALVIHAFNANIVEETAYMVLRWLFFVVVGLVEVGVVWKPIINGGTDID